MTPSQLIEEQKDLIHELKKEIKVLRAHQSEKDLKILRLKTTVLDLEEENEKLKLGTLKGNY